MDDTCSIPRCRQPGICGYIGATLCGKHHTELCEAHDKSAAAEQKFLARIGLHRNEDGAVVNND